MNDLHWHVHHSNDQLIAVCLYPEDAAVLVAATGTGATVWHVEGPGAGRLVWTEGAEERGADDDYDRTGGVMRSRAERVPA